MQPPIAPPIEEQQRPLGSLASPAALTYLAIAFAAAACLAPSFQIDFGWQLLVLAVALLALALLRLWIVPLVLLLVLGNLLLTEAPIADGSSHRLYELASAAALLVFVLAAGRYVVLCSTVVSFYRSMLEESIVTWAKRVLRPGATQSRGVAGRDPASFTSGELITAVARVLLAVAAAAVLLWAYPIDPDSGHEVGVMPTATRAIQLTIAVLVAVLVVHYAVEAIAWRLISRAEARMFLRGELFDEHRADLQRIAYYQQKHLRKQR